MCPTLREAHVSLKLSQLCMVNCVIIRPLAAAITIRDETTLTTCFSNAYIKFFQISHQVTMANHALSKEAGTLQLLSAS